jgi:hypothetical protein
MATNTLPQRTAFDLPHLAVLLTAALQILTPLLPQIGIGEPIGSRSLAVRTLITPAGWAFSIWGALYLGATVFAVYQALPAQRQNALLHRLRWPAAGAFLGNALWAAYTQLYGLTCPILVHCPHVVETVHMSSASRGPGRTAFCFFPSRHDAPHASTSYQRSFE